MRKKPGCRILIFLFGMGVLLAVFAVAQFREYYFYGKVFDTQKNPLESVELTLRDVSTSRSYHVKTNKKGEFKLAGLPHGVYKASFKKEGFAVKEDEWRFETPQAAMQKTEIPDIVLVTVDQIRKQEELKELQGALKEASEKIKQGDYGGAEALLKAVLEENPSDTNALYLLGIARARKKMYPEAVEALTRVIQSNPDFAPALFELAVCHQRMNEPDRALELYQKTIEADPANPDAHYNIGLILFEKNRADEALGFFEKALSLKPGDPAYLEMAGRCFINRADFLKAVEYLEKAKAGYTDADRIKFLDELITKLKEQSSK